jgi:hypothetical protein
MEREMKKRNFLLGRGERLTEDVIIRSGGGEKAPPYTFLEAKNRLAPRLSSAISDMDKLPTAACPGDQAVISLTLNPEYIAKSYFPDQLLNAVGITQVGSRPKRITPEKRSKQRAPVETLTTELFAIGKRDAIRQWKQRLSDWTPITPGGSELVTIEDISLPSADDKIKGTLPSSGTLTLEVVLHTDALLGETYLLSDFRNYLGTIGIEAHLDKRFYAGGLCFLELTAPAKVAGKIARFSVVRALREMPRLRMLRPTIRSSSIPSQELQLPTEPALNPNMRVAIFDGGLPTNHPIHAWANPIDAPNIGAKHPELIKHGVGVTSAFLFGHLDPNKPIPRPYANVDHYRVLDDEPGQNPHELFEVLARIDSALESTHYDFVNLSLGPRLPIEDDDVHVWTAVLDDRLGKADTLAAIAVGNDGEGDPTLGLNRIQVPADCVNALAIGACDSPDKAWQRAPYSSIGPGRSPGLMKPDLIEFGGSMARPFLVISEHDKPSLDATGGTSFATPSVLRLATGIRAHFGDNLSLLAIRALLVHSAESRKLPPAEIGWGRVARSLDDIVVCDDNTVRVVYQGKISAGKSIRAAIPLPNDPITGEAIITATICYRSPTDPHHPGNYTRAGLGVTFRPHDQRYSRDKQTHPDPKSFFGTSRSKMTEDELRRDAMKWENCLHASRRIRGTGLRNPCFDIHYNARLEGRTFAPEQALHYALVVSVKARNVADLYNQIVRKYSTQLEALRPTIEIPVQT